MMLSNMISMAVAISSFSVINAPVEALDLWYWFRRVIWFIKAW